MLVTERHITATSFGPCRTDWVMGAMVDLEIICQYWPLADWQNLSSLLILQSTVVTIRTAQWSLYVPTGLTLTYSTFCPHSAFMCFVWIWEQTAIISLYSINWLVFITETECVYCAVWTGSLYIILRSAHTVYLCVLCGSENKQRLFPYTALTDWFL